MKDHQRQTLVVVTPCFNEQDSVATFHAAVTDVLSGIQNLDFRLLFVDDGSSDRTLERLQALEAADARVGILSFTRNFGHQMALTAGLANANGDAVVLMDVDLQHPPSLLPAMIDSWRNGADVVSAVRQQTTNSSLFKRWTSSLFYRVINGLSPTRVEPGAADFCLLSRRAADALADMPERHRFLRGMIAWTGFRRDFIPFVAPERSVGHTKFTSARMLKLALDAVFSFSVLPMRLAVRLGVTVAGAGFVYLLYILHRAVFWGDTVTGWASVASAVLVMGGTQLTFIGIMGEYIGRIFEQVKHRPMYLCKYKSAHLPTRNLDEPRNGART